MRHSERRHLRSSSMQRRGLRNPSKDHDAILRQWRNRSKAIRKHRYLRTWPNGIPSTAIFDMGGRTSSCPPLTLPIRHQLPCHLRKLPLDNQAAPLNLHLEPPISPYLHRMQHRSQPHQRLHSYIHHPAHPPPPHLHNPQPPLPHLHPPRLNHSLAHPYRHHPCSPAPPNDANTHQRITPQTTLHSHPLHRHRCRGSHRYPFRRRLLRTRLLHGYTKDHEQRTQYC